MHIGLYPIDHSHVVLIIGDQNGLPEFADQKSMQYENGLYSIGHENLTLCYEHFKSDDDDDTMMMMMMMMMMIMRRMGLSTMRMMNMMMTTN